MEESKSNTGNVVFYCKDCEKIVDTNKVGSKYVYTCKLCGTKNVAFGTKKSIFSFFHVQDEPEVKPVEVSKTEEVIAIPTESTEEEVAEK
jgi:DNA replicative helicase MCM subunit Mcm2 (Cdc46/Mcm family)